MSTRQNNDKDPEAEKNLKRLTFGRRTFLKGAIAAGLGGLSGALFRPISGMAHGTSKHRKKYRHHKFITEQPRKVPVIEDVDVLVVGGGIAGVGAAIAAGRMGAKTLIIEYFGCLGGNGTSGMVNNFCGYSSSSPAFQIVKGVGDDILANLYARGGNASRTSTTFNPEILKMVLDDMMAEANVELMYYTQMVDVIMKHDTVEGVIIENKGARQAILAKRVCDCTGDGDVCSRAGVPFELGDGAGGFLACDTAHHLVNVGDYDRDQLNDAIAAAIDAGDTRITRPQVILQNILIPGVFWVNWAGVPWNVNGVDPYQLSKAAVDGRKVADGLKDFLRENVPGFEDAAIVDTAPKMGLRETRRVMGDYVLTRDDVLDGVKFADGIGACAWPIEIVDPDPLKGRTFERLRNPSDYYLIPYRCLLPENTTNLLMAGRFVSCTHLAQASTRVMGPAVVMGQAVGTAAAVSIQERVSPRRLNVGLLQNELAAAGAFLG